MWCLDTLTGRPNNKVTVGFRSRLWQGMGHSPLHRPFLRQSFIAITSSANSAGRDWTGRAAWSATCDPLIGASAILARPLVRAAYGNSQIPPWLLFNVVPNAPS